MEKSNEKGKITPMEQTFFMKGWTLERHETFWELTGFGFLRNTEVKRVRARAFPGWVIHWEVLHKAFWELTCSGSVRAPKLSRKGARVFP
ncbi:hypothetical protein DVH24_001405 [Malus domestica]|uniref:Uncharacterized protein n=1 Tax=Malus domestica TaxID=3750 RepID=A0A498K0N8_MALDO|nr:hypothetical protein DVH24_001405 [Malus domestica]